MKSFFKHALLTAGLALGVTGSASANQMFVFVTVSQLQSAFTSSVFGNNIATGNPYCASNLTNCGIYGVGFVSASGLSPTTVSTSSTITSDVVDTGSDKWVSTTYNGYKMWEAGGTAAGNTQEQLISQVNPTTGINYTTNTGGNSLTGIAAMNATTAGSAQIGFLLDFATNIAAGTTTNLTLQLLGVTLNTTTGAEGTKALAGQLTISNVTLVPTPEPSSIGLAIAGLAGIAMGARRRRKNQ